jgi:trk system potassium uptake protein TrkH
MILSGPGARLLGLISLLLAPLPLAPLAVDLHAGLSWWPWVETAGLFLALGLALSWMGRRRPLGDVGPVEGALITTLAWLLLSLVAGWGIHEGTAGSTYGQGVFEAISALTTTGSSAFGEAVPFAAMSPGVLLWRSICCAVGGIGVVVMTLALLPLIGSGGYQLFRSEVSGLALDRLTPRLADTVRLIAGTNLLLMLVVAAALHLCGVPWFHAACHALATISTAGFSSYANGAEDLPAAGQWVVMAGVVAGGINMALVLTALRGRPVLPRSPALVHRMLAVGQGLVGRWRILAGSEELRAYLGILAVLGAGVVAILLATGRPYGEDIATAVRHGLFAVVSLGSSAGFTLGYEADPRSWNAWHPGAQFLLIVASLGVACVGSTGGGVKAVRLLLVLKVARRAVRQFREPALIAPITLDGRPLAERTVLGALILLGLFAGTWAAGSLALLLLAPIDLVTACTASLASVGNIGPGLGAVGPERSFQALGPGGQAVCAVLMLLGRIEFVAVLALLAVRR